MMRKKKMFLKKMINSMKKEYSPFKIIRFLILFKVDGVHSIRILITLLISLSLKLIVIVG